MLLQAYCAYPAASVHPAPPQSSCPTAGWRNDGSPQSPISQRRASNHPLRTSSNHQPHSTLLAPDPPSQDYDCFYASVFEAKNPALKSLPFAVQQKQIIVTCNYEARRRGLHKLQLIRDAKMICPDVVIELGEDISPFRDASKELYSFLEAFSWNGKVERLGFDEV